MDERFGYLKDSKEKKDPTIRDFTFDISELALLASYVISDNKNITRSALENIRKVMKLIDVKAIGNDRLHYIDFINKGLEARIDYNLRDRSMILSHISGGLGTPEDENKYEELNNSEITWVNESIIYMLKYSYIQRQIEPFMDLATKFKAAQPIDRSEIVDEMCSWVDLFQNHMREAKVLTLEEEPFYLKDGKALNMIRDVYLQAINPSSFLRFGTAALNLITGGGLYGQKVYVILGLPGEGKSALLLDMAIQVKRYNRGYICKDPTKKPCVLLSLMENSIKETIERLYNMLTYHSIKECISADAAVKEFMEKGLRITDEDPIDLVIDFKPMLSQDTSYLHKRIDDLSDEGYEVICVFQDYLKCIHSVKGSFNGDFRRELGAIISEFKILATLKDIPVVTASQLNREATSKIDNARNINKSDLVRMLGRANVAESNLILENADWIAQITPENDSLDGVKYLGIKRVKNRYYISEACSVYFMPYISRTVKLVEDIDMPQPTYKESLVTDNGSAQLNNGMSTNIIGSAAKSVKVISNKDSTINLDQTSDNIFVGATGYAARDVSKQIIQLDNQWLYNNKYKSISFNNPNERKQMYELVKK